MNTNPEIEITQEEFNPKPFDSDFIVIVDQNQKPEQYTFVDDGEKPEDGGSNIVKL